MFYIGDFNLGVGTLEGVTSDSLGEVTKNNDRNGFSCKNVLFQNNVRIKIVDSFDNRKLNFHLYDNIVCT